MHNHSPMTPIIDPVEIYILVFDLAILKKNREGFRLASYIDHISI